MHGGGANDGCRRALMYCSLHAPARLPAGHSCSMLEEYRRDGVSFQLNGGGGGGRGGRLRGAEAVAAVLQGWGEIALTCHPISYDDE